MKPVEFGKVVGAIVEPKMAPMEPISSAYVLHAQKSAVREDRSPSARPRYLASQRLLRYDTFVISFAVRSLLARNPLWARHRNLAKRG